MELLSLPDNLDTTAFDLFRYWTTEAKKCFPDLSFSILDESKLVTDLKNSLTLAFECLIKEDKKKRNYLRGSYDRGYMYSFIHSNLNLTWYFEYIIKQSREYREISMLSALSRYLENDNLTKILISHEYSTLLKECINLKNYNEEIPELKIDLNTLRVSILHDDSNEYDLFHTAIENIRLIKILDCMKQKFPNFLPEIKNYFSDEQINSFILHNEIAYSKTL
ncbi:MAG: hypothetical protein GX640_22895 [Fibrobacter sp.]|nr:hypothetical protein [Fibrobacter sp.]